MQSMSGGYMLYNSETRWHGGSHSCGVAALYTENRVRLVMREMSTWSGMKRAHADGIVLQA